MESIRSISLAHGTFCLVTPSCPVSLTMKPDTWIQKVLWKLSHAGREDYECNAGLKDIDSSLLCPAAPCEYTESRSVCFSVEQCGETTPWSPCSLSLTNTAQQCEREGWLWGIWLLTQVFHIYEGRRKEEYISRKKNLQVIWPIFFPLARGSELMMQAVFYLCSLHRIDLTMRQRDASQGKTGLLIAIVYHHPYTHAYTFFSSHRKVHIVFLSALEKIFCNALEDRL